MAWSSMSQYADMDRVRSWSRHSDFQTPQNMRDVWKTSYQNSFNGKKIGYHPDRFIIDYFSGNRHTVPSSRHSYNRFRTSLNERAREGFRYWLLDKSTRTKFGKYGTGAYKAVLGISDAPCK